MVLFDQNLSFRLATALSADFPACKHVRDIGLEEASDEIIWDYAKTNGLAIVSKDADFHQRSFLFGFPPKVIWICKGNCSTNEIETLISRSLPKIRAFLKDQEGAFMALE